jgi:hypothetical protein
VRSQLSVTEPKFPTVVYRSETLAVDVVQHVLYFEVRSGLEEKETQARIYSVFQNTVSDTPEFNVKVHTVV